VLAQQDDRLIAFSVTDTQVLTAPAIPSTVAGPDVRRLSVLIVHAVPACADGVPVPESPPGFWET
jgi:hypothetical protein